jgi:hypothetical protein
MVPTAANRFMLNLALSFLRMPAHWRLSSQNEGDRMQMLLANPGVAGKTDLTGTNRLEGLAIACGRS